jgi:hypothetical protein
MRTVIRKRVTAAAFCGVILLAAQGCSSGHGGGNRKPVTLSHPQPMPLNVAMQEAQVQGSLEKTVEADVTVQVTDTSSSGKTNTTSAGTMQAVLKPTTISEANLSLSSSGKTVPMQEIESGNTTYLKLASLSGMTGKPWVAVTSSVTATSLGMAQGGNPLASDQFLSVSKNLHVVGTAVVNQVGTTEYEGSYPAAAMLTGLSPALRKHMSAELKHAGPVKMSVWISRTGRLQKVLSVEAISSEMITTTIDITGVNMPLQITVPAPSQVAHIPASALGGL